VSGSRLLPERDLRALSAVVEDGLRDAPSKVMPWAVLDGLLRLIPSEGIQIEERDPRGRRIVAQQTLVDGGQRCTSSDLAINDTHYWTLSEQFQPNSYPIRTGDVARPMRYSDFYAFSELRQIPFYVEYLAPDRDGLVMLLPTGTQMHRRLSLWRSRHDFDERDRLILQLLRPHLHEVFLDAQRRRRGLPHLSRREQQVLHLVSQGHSNADIARMLSISIGTVRKHMEHIFDRTGVRSRSAAAALTVPSPLRFNSVTSFVSDRR
jgi:DNA-binding CsgD family transcriptional regulator